jgi:hypothetical protein
MREQLLLSVFMLHVVLTYFMAGVMWFVQLAYYPNLAVVGREAFVGYQRAHIRRITRVAWTMLVLELASGVVLACIPSDALTWSSLAANAVLIGLIWWSTWFVQVPLHTRLEQGWDEAAHARLVRTNWFRTVVYTLRGLIVLFVLWTAVTTPVFGAVRPMQTLSAESSR